MSRFFRFSFLTLAIVAASVSQGFSQAPATSTTPPEFDAGIAELRKGNVPEAIKDFREASVKHPEIAPPWIIMYNIFMQPQQQDVNKARQALEQAVLDSPTDPEAYVIMGNIALNERRLAEAELLYLKSQNLLATFSGSPQRKKILDPMTISGLANVEEVRGKWDRADKQLNVLLAMEPKNAGVMQRLARALFFEKKTPESLKMLRDAKAADANVLTPEAALAGFYEQYGDRPNASDWFERALKAAPGDLATHRIVARWALGTGQIDKAKEQAEKCLSMDSKSLENLLLRGLVALYEEDFTKAEEYFQLAHLDSPGNFEQNNLALAMCEQKDPATGNPNGAKLQRALELAKQNYDANQRNPDACSTFGWVLFKKKEYDQAALALRAALQAGNGGLSADTAYYLAMVENVRGTPAKAKEIIEQIIKTDKPFAKRKAANELLKSLKDVSTTPPATPTTSQK